MSSIVVGVGNPLLGDDAIGLEVADRLSSSTNTAIKKAVSGGIELAELIAGYDFALILDAYHGEGIKEIDVDKYHESVPNHDITFPCAYHILSKYIGMPKVRVLGIGVSDIEIRENLSEKTRKSIPEIINLANKILKEEHDNLN